MNKLSYVRACIKGLLIFLTISCGYHPQSEQKHLLTKDEECSLLLEEKQCLTKPYSCLWNIDTCIPRWNTKLPNLPAKLKKAKQVKADEYVCAIDERDELSCISNLYSHIYPHKSLKFTSVETQDKRVCGVLMDGDGICYTQGKKDVGLSFIKKLSKLSPFGKHTCGIYEDGNFFCVSDNLNIENISAEISKTQLKKISSLVVNRDYHLGLLDETNQLVGFSFDNNQWISTGPIADVSLATVATSQISTTILPDGCIITKNKLICRGKHYNQKEIEIPKDIENENFIFVSVGESHTCAILEKNQQPKCWGAKSKGQLEIPKNLKQVKSIVAGNKITCFIDINDKIGCFGKSL